MLASWTRLLLLESFNGRWGEIFWPIILPIIHNSDSTVYIFLGVYVHIFLSRFTCLKVQKCHSSGIMLRCKEEQYLFVLQQLGSIQTLSGCSIQDAFFSTSSVMFHHHSIQPSGRWVRALFGHINIKKRSRHKLRICVLFHDTDLCVLHQ